MAESRYRLSDLPTGRVTDVEVGWAGRVLRVHRMLDHASNRMRWCEYRDGKLHWLPPNKQVEAWGEDPEWWRPTNPKWTWPNGVEPEPLPILVQPRLTYIRNGYGSVEAMTDEEMARERADMRHEAETRDRGDGDSAHVPWWRDGWRIRYQPKGEVTREMAEGRVMRALAMAGPTFADFRARFQVTASWMEAISDEMTVLEQEAERLISNSRELPRLVGNEKDGNDFLQAMSWFAALGVPGKPMTRRQKVMMLKAGNRVLSWWNIAFSMSSSASQRRLETDVSPARVQQLYESGIDGCLMSANGLRRRVRDLVKVQR